MKLSDFLIRSVVEQGVRHVFFVPGGAAMHLNDSLGASADLTAVAGHHEQASAIAAEAYARVTRGLGVCMVTAGPGGTNAVTGVAAAWQDSTPCLFLSGQVKRADLAGRSGVRQKGVQEIDIVSIVKPITKYAVTIIEPESIRYHVEKALHLATTGRPGPVWIDCPLDVQAADVDPGSMPGFIPEPEVVDSETIEQGVSRALEMLSKAKRPVILVGNGVRAAGAQSRFLELVDRLGLPVLTTRLGVDLIPYDHTLCCGMPGVIASRAANFTLQNSDWLLMLGARMDFALIAYAPERLAPHARKIMVNIDSAEICKLGATIDVPVAADAGRFIEEMLSESTRLPRTDRSAWCARCDMWKTRYPFALPAELVKGDGLSMYDFSAALSSVLDSNDLVLPGNSGFAAEIFLTAMHAKAGQRIFHNKGTGAMGFCQPAAIGACLGGEGRRTVCVDGDGGFQFNIQELETVRRLQLPIKFFVINNAGYASIRASQGGYFNRLVGADRSSGLTLPDYIKVATAYGLDAVRIDGAAEMPSKLRAVLDSPGPVVCEVIVKPDEPRAPRVSSIKKPDGSMESMPLENMWPFLSPEEMAENMIGAADAKP
ncbi:MAG: thiamine pyrophosphate-binding protein [Planctomycetota bacterium]